MLVSQQIKNYQVINCEQYVKSGPQLQWHIQQKETDRNKPLLCISIFLSRSYRTGCMALRHSRRTLDGVSSPARVVRSIHVTAFSSQAAYRTNTHKFHAIIKKILVNLHLHSLLLLMSDALSNSLDISVASVSTDYVQGWTIQWFTILLPCISFINRVFV